MKEKRLIKLKKFLKGVFKKRIQAFTTKNIVGDYMETIYNKDGKFIKEWESTMEVQRQLNINNSNIVQCCLGNRKTAGGFIWEYQKKKL